MSNAVADVQTRIAAIQQRIATLDPNASNSGSAFADKLSAVLGGVNSSSSSASASVSASSTSSSSGTCGSDVVDAAKKYLGVPYVWGGTSDTGLDCSGLVQKAYGDLGVQLPRVAADQAKMGTAVASLDQAKPGDLVAFGSPVDHIGIYVGDNKMIVAPKRGDVVKIQDVYKTPTAIRRIVDDSTAAGAFGGVSAVSTSSSSAISSSLHSKYDSLFVQAGAKYNLSPNLLAAVAKQESGFNPNAGSGAGAQGLMQLMPSTAKSLGVGDPYDPAQAVEGAAKMLSGLVQKFGSNDLALAAYNAGPGAVTKYGGIPPYKETQNYVKNVLAMASGGGR